MESIVVAEASSFSVINCFHSEFTDLASGRHRNSNAFMYNDRYVLEASQSADCVHVWPSNGWSSTLSEIQLLLQICKERSKRGELCSIFLFSSKVPSKHSNFAVPDDTRSSALDLNLQLTRSNPAA
jgi:hypothetical protein